MPSRKLLNITLSFMRPAVFHSGRILRSWTMFEVRNWQACVESFSPSQTRSYVLRFGVHETEIDLVDDECQPGKYMINVKGNSEIGLSRRVYD